eukprot:CAMPEP_0113930754 /NCGR_PEP_ID=MMETSP1159-20121227/6137_1 /TAXON_ID=88271 /ORGANISM="Picocystis salinarum" /LENGTH=255 /DNA_ID=CAMNT_0000931595 /DNA_START=57 /DNA_END=825 /DNA_ORIENTATION=+ /assembly_acc=CAM_ASM_000767
MQTRAKSNGGKRGRTWRDQERKEQEKRTREGDSTHRLKQVARPLPMRCRDSLDESVDAVVAAAETWDYLKEQDAYEKAQLTHEDDEALAMFEQAHEEALRQIAENDLVDKTRHVELLKMGSAMLTNPCDRLTYEELTSVQDAARRLEKLCDEQKENAVELEKKKLLEELHTCRAALETTQGNAAVREAKLISTISKMYQQMEMKNERDNVLFAMPTNGTHKSSHACTLSTVHNALQLIGRGAIPVQRAGPQSEVF